MNKLYITLFFIIFFVGFLNAIKTTTTTKSLSTGSGLINILVDSNSKNVYPLNGQCGNSTTFTCNNVIDAYNYGSSSGNFSQINFVLADGIYGIAENSLSIFNIGVGYIADSNNVIFDGTINATGNPLVTVNSDNTDANGIITTIYFKQIQFKGFSTPIVKATTVLSTIDLEIEQCVFSNYTTTVQLSMFDINSVGSSGTKNPSTISFSDSNFVTSKTFSAPLLKISSATITFTYTNASQINSNNFLFSTFSTIKADHGTFIGGTTSTGIFSIQNSNFQGNQLTFIGNNATLYGSALTMISSVTGTYSTSFTQCQFTGGDAFEGGAVYFENNSTSPEMMPSSFDTCTFNGNSATLSGGALYISNVPVNIINSNFQSSNTAGVSGGIIYVSNSTDLVIQLSNIFTNGSILSTSGVILYTTSSSVDIKNCTFDKFTGSGNGIYCISSTINMENNKNYTNSIVCSNCNVPGTCFSSTTSTTGTGGGTTGGGNPFSISSSTFTSTTTGNTSNSNSIFNQFNSLFSLFTITFFIFIL